MPDRDFLEDVKKTEEEAEARVEKARQQAQLQRQTARQEAADMVDRAYREAGDLRLEKMKKAEEAYRLLVSDSTSLNVQKPEAVSGQLKAEAAALLAERILSILEHR